MSTGIYLFASLLYMSYDQAPHVPIMMDLYSLKQMQQNNFSSLLFIWQIFCHGHLKRPPHQLCLQMPPNHWSAGILRLMVQLKPWDLWRLCQCEPQPHWSLATAGSVSMQGVGCFTGLKWEPLNWDQGWWTQHPANTETFSVCTVR